MIEEFDWRTLDPRPARGAEVPIEARQTRGSAVTLVSGRSRPAREAEVPAARRQTEGSAVTLCRSRPARRAEVLASKPEETSPRTRL